MIDTLGSAVSLLRQNNLLAYPLLVAGGAMTSITPCVAARCLAASSLAQGARRPTLTTLAFAFGMIVAFIGIGLAASTLISHVLLSTQVNFLLAAALSFAAVREMFARRHDCADECKHKRDGGLGVAFASGAASTLVMSPCCGPIVVVLGALSSSMSSVVSATFALAAFAVGHALPLLAAASLRTRSSRQLSPTILSAMQTVSGALLLAFGLYYGAIA